MSARVLIAFERSGGGRRAFEALGHDAWSCDIEPADDASNSMAVDCGNLLPAPRITSDSKEGSSEISVAQMAKEAKGASTRPSELPMWSIPA